MAKASSRWIGVFEEFIKDIRISSKESVSTDERGSPLVLWESQKRFLEHVGRGLDDDIRIFNCLKSRQLGVTTISLAIDVLWLAMHPNLIGCLVADTEKNINANRSLIEKYVKSFPDGYFGDDFRVTKSNRSFIEFSNKSRLNLLVAGTKKKGVSWAEGVGYAFAHLTETSKYGDPDALASLEESFAQQNPNRLFIYESTANGTNHWMKRWQAGQKDVFTQRSFFLGWWSSDVNIIKRSDPRFTQYGGFAASGDEREKIAAVARLYGYKITPEQLAWIRWKSDNTGSDNALLEQNQPWTERDAFIESGYSFFQTRQISMDLKTIREGGEDYGFQAYRYEIDGGFFNMKLEKIEDESDMDRIELKVWEEPVPNGKYAIGFDPAWGRNDHKDRSCLSWDSEILTKDGWKKPDQIQINDEAVCFDLETEQYRYGKISEKIVKQFSGNALHFTSDGLDCLVTPDHRTVTRVSRPLRSGRPTTWRFKTAQQLADSACKTIHDIPPGGAPIGNGIDGLSLDMCRALGWIMTDGHVARTTDSGKSRYAIHVVQSLFTVKEGVNVSDEMDRIFSRLCPNATVRKIMKPNAENRKPFATYYIGVKEAEQFFKWMEPEGNRIKRQLLTDASKDQLEHLFQGILDGDGCWDKKANKWALVTPGLCREFADDIQELACRLGHSATVVRLKGSEKNGRMCQGQWGVRLAKRFRHCTRLQKSYETPYDGLVWCVIVPTGAFVARRNGKMFVTGNCIEVYRCYADKIVQVAEYATADVELKHAAWTLAHLAGCYKDCVVIPEITGPGRALFMEWDHLKQMMQSETYRDSVVNKSVDWEAAFENARWYLYSRPDSMGKGFALGFETSWRTKAELMHQMRGEFVTKSMIVRSIPLLNEMLNVIVDEGGSIGAPESSNADMKDDRVFATALAIRAWINWIRPSMLSDGLTYKRVNEEESGDVTPLNKSLNNIVFNFFRTQQELAEAETDKPTWLTDRGLI